MLSNRPDRDSWNTRAKAWFVAPAFVLVLTACGGEANDVASSASAPTTSAGEDASASTAGPATEAPATEQAAAGTEPVDDDGSSETSAPSETVSIQRLSADEAIANAETNQSALQSADDVLDIETLAIADGSAQTLREVVDGDRPVLLWFFAPH